MRMKTACLATIIGFTLSGQAVADGDPAAGEKVFKKCQACHAVGEGAKNKVGPSLNGVVGSPAGQVEDFKYSANMLELAEGGLVWDEETLTAYLHKPKDVVPKQKCLSQVCERTKMSRMLSPTSRPLNKNAK